MTTAKLSKNGKKSTTKANDVLATSIKGLDIIGQVITWSARTKITRTHSSVVKALKESGLDEKVAREILPPQAFARAAKKLNKERIIDRLKTKGGDIITFQFTKKHIEDMGGAEEWKYNKETFLRLDKSTGKVTCLIKDLEDQAQKELDRCLEERTNSDINNIVQKLFERETDMIPFREQGGVYIVLKDLTEHSNKIEDFLTKVGGRMKRLPIPAGTESGDRAVQESLTDFLRNLLTEHNEAIEDFSSSTRRDTLEGRAEKINETRVKIQAYASYLKEESVMLLKEVEESEELLLSKIHSLINERKTVVAK